MRAYVINLDGAQDRLGKFMEESSRANLEVVRVPGVRGSDLDSIQRRTELTTMCNYTCTDSAIGCALAHKRAWKMALDDGCEHALICEDDCYFSKDFADAFPRMLNFVPNDFDVLFVGCEMGCSYEQKYSITMRLLLLFKKSSFRKVNEHVYVPELPLAAHCYFVSRKGLAKLLGGMQKISNHVDAQMNTIDGLVMYSLHPKLAFQRVSLYTTNNVPTLYPGKLNRIAEHVLDVDGRPYSYNLSIPIISAGNTHFSGWSIILVALALVLGASNVSIQDASHVYAAYAAVELSEFKFHLRMLLENYILLIAVMGLVRYYLK